MGLYVFMTLQTDAATPSQSGQSFVECSRRLCIFPCYPSLNQTCPVSLSFILFKCTILLWDICFE